MWFNSVFQSGTSNGVPSSGLRQPCRRGLPAHHQRAIRTYLVPLRLHRAHTSPVSTSLHCTFDALHARQAALVDLLVGMIQCGLTEAGSDLTGLGSVEKVEAQLVHDCWSPAMILLVELFPGRNLIR
jgi:hypothetical protein